MNKLELYKTAYSPLYETYVSIKSVYFDCNGNAVITARPIDLNHDVLFREHELDRYCL